ncbi:hypothetical protein ACIBKZ_20395 [Streptomyces sp. NPDC050421]|uniref:hypothetical protein n=1 Tax=unclassified Streptomyces TaxID=2593676 RepID=UPI0037A0CD0E
MSERVKDVQRVLRVRQDQVIDAVCALTWYAPPDEQGAGRDLYQQVLDTVAHLPEQAVEPGDISAALDVRAGVLDAAVPWRADMAAECIERLVDGLGIDCLAYLAHSTALTRSHLAAGAVTAVRDDSPASGTACATRTTAVAAQTVVDEIVTLPPGRWGRCPGQAVRASLYRCLADFADAFLDVSESTPAPVRWQSIDPRGPQTGHIRLTATRTLRLEVTQDARRLPQRPALGARPGPPFAVWQWRTAVDDPSGLTLAQGCDLPSAPAARHAAECAVSAIASRLRETED